MISNEHEDEDGGLTYRDLKEPEGWRFSSLRKILLLRLNDWVLRMVVVYIGEYGPACGFREVS